MYQFLVCFRARNEHVRITRKPYSGR